MDKLKIELVKPVPPFAPGDFFDRGERVIMVDGVRWGRTKVKFHGRRGPTYTFQQQNGETIVADPDARFVQNVEVRSRRRWEKTGPLTTDELVLEKVRELIQTDKLRDPQIVLAEREASRARFQAEQEAGERREAKEFRERARVALNMRPDDVGLNINLDDASDAIDRVVAAMRWAQTR